MAGSQDAMKIGHLAFKGTVGTLVSHESVCRRLDIHKVCSSCVLPFSFPTFKFPENGLSFPPILSVPFLLLQGRCMLSLKRAVFSSGSTFSFLWRKSLCSSEKGHFPMYHSHWPRMGSISLPSLPWIWLTSLLASSSLTVQLPHAAHFNPEDGDNMFTWNVGICLQGTHRIPGDCSVTVLFLLCVMFPDIVCVDLPGLFPHKQAYVYFWGGDSCRTNPVTPSDSIQVNLDPEQVWLLSSFTFV